MGDVDNGAGSDVLCRINDELEGDFDLFGDVLAADFVLTEAQRAALLRTGRALTPADGAHTISTVLARRVAQGAALLLLFVAGQLDAVLTTVDVLGAGDANISHSRGAVRRANAASNVVETGVALRVPQHSILLAVR